ncbi:MAG: nucleotidyltransferase domain-containing protein, partial [Lentisphaeria bacterium]|nr:nucleotidyltransferase domain-containing protein [Lentisphaeria bacterium]
WYLTIQHKRDVIERAVDGGLDISGWDLPKSLELLRKSNPPLLEWLQSPIVYREVGTAAAKLRELMPRYYAPTSCLYHYLHMARGNSRQYLQGDVVWVKKYFYVLRPVLACLWIERGFGVVPTEFRILVNRLVGDPTLRAAIDDLLARKRAGQELDQGPRLPRVSDFLDRELSRLAAVHAESPETRDPAALDGLFLDLLVETYGDRLRH